MQCGTGSKRQAANILQCVLRHMQHTSHSKHYALCSSGSQEMDVAYNLIGAQQLCVLINEVKTNSSLTSLNLGVSLSLVFLCLPK